MTEFHTKCIKLQLVYCGRNSRFRKTSDLANMPLAKAAVYMLLQPIILEGRLAQGVSDK